MRPFKIMTLVLVALVAASCAPVATPRTTVNVIGDRFSKAVTLEGLPMIDPNNGDGLFWMLRSVVDQQARSAQHQIYVEWTYPGRASGRYFAADDSARALPVAMIFKDRADCPFKKCDRVDTIGIAIDEATLRARATTGFEVKLSAQDGTSGILSITPPMIVAQLQAEDRIIAAPAGISPAAAAATANALTGSGRPLLGIAPLDLPFGAGVQVNRVDPNTPAAAAGFQVGDLVVRYNGQPVTGADQLRTLIAQTALGSRVPIDITRHGTPMTLSAQM